MSAKTIISCRFIEPKPEHLSVRLRLKYPDDFLYAMAVAYAVQGEEVFETDDEIEAYVEEMMR